MSGTLRRTTLLVEVLLVATSIACVVDRPATSRIVDPSLPSPTLCFGAAWPCGVGGLLIHKTNELIVSAAPLDSLDEHQQIWRVEAQMGFDRSKPIYVRYGEAPPNWTEVTPAQPLQPGYLYEFQNVRFVVEEGRIRRVWFPARFYRKQMRP